MSVVHYRVTLVIVTIFSLGIRGISRKTYFIIRQPSYTDPKMENKLKA